MTRTGLILARSTKVRRDGQDAPPPEKLLETILADVLATAAMPFADWMALTDNPINPLAIPVSGGSRYKVTQEGVNAAHRLTEQTWGKREDFRQTIDRAEFDRLAFQAIGQTVRDCRSHIADTPSRQGDQVVDDAFLAAMVADYECILDRLAADARPDTNRHIPCHLFHADQCVPAFSVGPVHFLPRSDWIAENVRNPKQLPSVQQVERREKSYKELREKSYAAHSDKNTQTAQEVLKSLGNFDWVATVSMVGHELRRAHYKASLMVGLAMDAIGLRFEVEHARLLAKAGRQHLYSENRLATFPDGTFLRGWSARMPGVGFSPGALARKMTAEQAFLDAAGKLLENYAKGRQTGSAPHLIERRANALYWTGEARREASDFIAVVKYGCAVDVLSGAGGNSREMEDFAEAALNPEGKPTQPAVVGISDVVRKVYLEGRNKLAHGEAGGLLEDFSEIRSMGDMLMVGLFDAVTFALTNVIDQRSEWFKLSERHAYQALKTRLRQRTR